jgi:hypothetical protein
MPLPWLLSIQLVRAKAFSPSKPCRAHSSRLTTFPDSDTEMALTVQVSGNLASLPMKSHRLRTGRVQRKRSQYSAQPNHRKALAQPLSLC